MIDIGKIGPDYIPGHAHADTFSFLLYLDKNPVIVDTGTSTYDKNELRLAQRATRAHNTVEIDGRNQSEVWGGFRVARRAEVTPMEETLGRICAYHNGYQRLAGQPIHFRTWRFYENGLEVNDEIKGVFREAVARFHFHPNVQILPSTESYNSGIIRLPDASVVRWRISMGIGKMIETTYHPRFNISQPNLCLEIQFTGPSAGIKFTW